MKRRLLMPLILLAALVWILGVVLMFVMGAPYALLQDFGK